MDRNSEAASTVVTEARRAPRPLTKLDLDPPRIARPSITRSIGMALLACTAGLAPSSALAGPVPVYFTGTILGGNDTTGYFTGIPGFDLTTVDAGLGTPYLHGIFSYDADAFAPDGTGVFGYDGVTDWLGFSVTIAGTTYAFGTIDGSGSDIQGIVVTDGVDDLNFLLSRDGTDGAEFVSIDLADLDFFSGTDLPTAFTYKSPTGGTGYLNIQALGANLDAASFSITCASTDQGACPIPDGGVPEPSSWLTLTLGFGTLGAILRRKRKRITDRPTELSDGARAS